MAMDSFIVNRLEQRLGVDLNGDGYVGGEGYHSMLERALGIDLNGDGIIGRLPDVVPGNPVFYGYPTIPYRNVMYGYPYGGYTNMGFYPRYY